MNQLNVFDKNGQLLVDSREVSEMISKPHYDLIKSIKVYIQHLTKGNFSVSDFFIADMYKDSTGRNLPCFLLTRKGCDMVANKMTGEKGVLFTAAYVSKFEEMEKQINEPKALSPTEQLKASMRLSLETSEELNEVKTKVSSLEQRFDNELTLNHGQATSLNHAVKKRIEKLWSEGIKGTLETKHQMYSRIYSQMKRAFQAPTYREVKRKDFEEAVQWVSAWRPL